MTEAEIEFKRGQLEALRAAYRLFGQGDLMKFWLFAEHRGIDKWVNYFPVYEKWFAPYRDKEIVFVEIGVQNGGSIQMWRDYFNKDVKLVGVDINPDCKQFEDAEQNIFIEIGSQDDPNFWASFKKKYPRVDILLDDGGHKFNQQIVTFREMFPHIKDGGLYMCEDCHTSYWKLFDGGLKHEGTFIEFTKNLIDELNAFHSFSNMTPTYNSLNMGGVHFYTSMVVVEKTKIPFNPFDLRIGKETAVESFEDLL